MKNFLRDIYKFCLIGGGFLTIILAAYLIFDPFYVIKEYNDFSNKITSGNKDYISTTIFLRNYRKEKYDSYILGSSRTVAFQHSAWQKHLPDSSKIFTYDAYSETIYGIYKKIKLIDSLGLKLNNVLIIVEKDETFMTENNSKGYLFIKHPVLSGENFYEFHWEFLKSYLTPKFLFCYYSRLIWGKYSPFMLGVIEPFKTKITPVSNETKWVELDQMLAESETEYYKKMNHLFPVRDGVFRTETKPKISAKQKKMLNEIKSIFNRHNTHYRFVISPLYQQVKFNKTDLDILKSTFGSAYVYDFSGINDLTKPKTNYYEFSHYRPKVGEQIMQHIYK
jgi:hypothetical protein